ncbi:restriction endonuclease subunit S [Avibacterium endocarditidis]|uniref:restriction endonuclease subunit S n=1 Tax=Avibacterium TaxID=292486 RepID=UPI0039FDAFAA
MTNKTMPMPKGWEINLLKRLCSIKTGDKDVNQGNENGIYPFFTCAQEISNSDTFSFEGEAILIAGNGNFNVKFYSGKFEAYQRTYVLQSFKNVNGKYLFYFIKNKLNDITKGNRGSTIKYIRLGDIADYPIIYPTNKATQQAIVNKIESLFAEIDAGIGHLKTAEQQLKQYRQALLKNAFNGELTKQWRTEHAESLPTATELLEHIQMAREQHHAQQLADWQSAVKNWEENGKLGKKPSKPKALQKLEPIAKLNEIELTELPDTWFWERLGLITLGVEYGTSAKSQAEGKVPVVRMGNMQNGKIDWTDLVYSNNDEEIKQYLLKKGDVLFNRTNSPELVGKTSIIETDEKAIFAGYLIRINHLTDIVDGRYLTYFLNSIIAKNYGNFVKTDGVNQSNINGQKLINYPFVFCSLAEQIQIVAILESKLTACDYLATELATQLKQAELLKQAVLKAAFSGSLLEQSQ